GAAVPGRAALLVDAGDLLAALDEDDAADLLGLRRRALALHVEVEAVHVAGLSGAKRDELAGNRRLLGDQLRRRRCQREELGDPRAERRDESLALRGFLRLGLGVGASAVVALVLRADGHDRDESEARDEGEQ